MRPGSVDAGRLLALRGWVVGLEEADHSIAQQALKDALVIARQHNDTALELRALINSANVNYFQGDSTANLENALQAIPLALERMGLRAEVSARYTAVLSSDFVGARAQASVMQPVAETIRDRYLIVTGIWLNQMLSNLEGDWMAARAFGDRGIEISPLDRRLLYSRIITEYELGDFSSGKVYLDQLAGIV
ncbi:MAG TPA: hypothetical protein EYO83_11090 [Gemmatimonadetes bacterium]|nr:hypothetical protein [Gemmatimonadota bacterium]